MMRTPLLFASLLALSAPLAACGGIVIEPPSTNESHAPAPASTSPATPTPTPSASNPPAPDPAPAPTPNPQPPTGDGIACWSPGHVVGDSGTPVSDSPCSLVGTWDYTASAGAKGFLAFDAFGNWVGSDVNPNLCTASTMSGTYTLHGSDFEFTTIHDTGLCTGDWGMSKIAAFDASCKSAKMKEQYDNCTGARPEFNYDLVLTKR